MWLVIVVLLAIIEFATVNLVSVWFILSGFIAMLVSLITDNFFIQFGVFAVLGLILMILTKPFLNRMVKERNEKINLERVVGMEGIVTEEIKKNIVGEVKVDGKRWSAIADETIPIETIVKINGIDGVKLVVENVEKKMEVETEEEEKPKTTTKNTTKKSTTNKSATKTSSAKKSTATKKKTTTKKSTNATKNTSQKKTSSKPKKESEK